MQNPEGQSWYQRDVTDVFAAFGTSERGLTAASVVHNRIHFQTTALKPVRPPSIPVVFLLQFKSPLVLLLVLASLFSILTGGYHDAVAIGVVLAVNAAIGTYFEMHTHLLTQQLKERVKPVALVRRDGKILEVRTSQLVLGDVLVLQSGMSVPADARVIRSDYLQLDESNLTGEALPVAKSVALIPHSTLLADQKNMVFEGTNVMNGQGEAVVVALQADTVVGTIKKESAESTPPQSPLIKRVTELNRIIGISAVVLGACIAVYLLVQGEPLLATVRMSIALMIAVVPEGLPILLTTALLLGIHRLAEKKALVKNMAAIDTIANVTTLITDKTGTITQNNLSVERVYLPTNFLQPLQVEVSNSFLPGMTQLVTASFLATERSEIGHLTHRHDPLEVALSNFATRIRSDLQKIGKQTLPVRVLPFSSDYKLMAAFYQTSPRITTAYCKGAWELILERSSYRYEGDALVEITPTERKALQRVMHREQVQGHKTIAIATRECKGDCTSNNSITEQLAELTELTLLGVVVFVDPVRPDAEVTISNLKHAGISLKIASGDHQSTTTSIAHSVGIPISLPPEKAVKDMTLSQIKNTTIFSRVSPLEKLSIVRALQKRHEVVAMTGDGANDAPALRQADIGIALNSNNDVARSAADIIILDGSLSTITNALQYGRVLTKNLQRIMLFLLTANGVEALVVTLVTLLTGRAEFLLPGQILWLNLLSDTPLAFPLAVRDEPSNFQNRTAPKQVFLLGVPEHLTVLLGGATLLLTTLFVYFSVTLLSSDVGVQQSAVLHAMIAGQIWLLLSSYSGNKSMLTIPSMRPTALYASVGFVVAFLCVTAFVQPIAALVQFTALPLGIVALAWGSSCMVAVTTEITKLATRKIPSAA